MNRTNKRNLTVIGKKTKSFQNPLMNSNIITTPYEKVLSILVNVKRFISNLIQDKYNFVKDIDWCIKVITSHSLYSYELKDKDAINQLSKENNEFKELVNFVYEYNENIIKMNRKYNHILTDQLLQKSSVKLNKRKIHRKNTYLEDESNLLKTMKSELKKEENLDDDDKKDNYSEKNKKKFGRYSDKDNKHYLKNEKNNNIIDENVNKRKTVKISEAKNSNINDNDEIKPDNSKQINNSQKAIKKSILKNKKLLHQSSLNEPSCDDLSYHKHFSLKENTYVLLNKDGHDISENYHRSNSIDSKKSKIKIPQIKSSNKIRKIFKEYSFFKIQNILLSENYDISKSITSKNFDIFQLENLIGYNNVLPISGRIILENLGLLDEGILNQDKLDNFLVSVSNQYKQDTLYHNSLHGTDVTQSSYIFFTHSNAEKIAKTNVIDLLSIIIAALGHDLGHPGLTNMFHMNDFTDIAITYNDISILENFHASLLFKTLRKTENNIFEKLSNIDYKIIRKRMISEILATDMANHGKVVSVIKSKIYLNEDNEYKLNLLSGNEQTKIEEQQNLLDFMLHLADLAHNTKLFNISLKWVELLSEEFWRQGDLEKEKNLPVSFLCDREKVNIPQSQKGFITGFIIPTFESLVEIFPSLKFTIDNAKNNLNEWQKLMDEGRSTGWTPKKNKKERKRRVRISIKEDRKEEKKEEKKEENVEVEKKQENIEDIKEEKNEGQKTENNDEKNNINKNDKDQDDKKEEKENIIDINIKKENKNEDLIKNKIKGKKVPNKNNSQIKNKNFFNDSANSSKNNIIIKNKIFIKKSSTNLNNQKINNSISHKDKISYDNKPKEIVAKSSKELKRFNKNNKSMKISILDEMPLSGDEDNEFKNEKHKSCFSKINLENRKI